MPRINLDEYDLDNYDDLYDDLESEKQARKNQSRAKKSAAYKEEFKKQSSHPSQNKIQTKARHHDDIFGEDDQDSSNEPIRTLEQATRIEAQKQKNKAFQQRPPKDATQAPQAHPYTAEPRTPKGPFVYGPNTHEIKSVKIDFDRVIGMERVQGEFKGNETFGIVFRFKGSAGSSRTIWFGRNVYERDAVFTAEGRFWANLKLDKN